MFEVDRRKSTTNDFNDTWSICQYYFTHNNGSSDDILLQDRKSHLNKVAKRYSILKRTRTYPLQQRQDSEQKKRRRWTTINRKQKRQTLANILSDLRTGNNSSTLERKWNSIRMYNPPLDNEKILLFEEDEGYSHTPVHLDRNTTTNTTATLYNDLRDSYQSTIKMSHFTTNNQQASTSDNTTTHNHSRTSSKREQQQQQDDTMMIISLPNVAEDIIHESASVQPPSPSRFYFEKKKRKIELHSDTDMFLFLFGFLLFPLWWYGTLRYFTETNVDILSKRQRCFQLINYLFSIASLLVLGLVVGLTTVYT